MTANPLDRTGREESEVNVTKRLEGVETQLGFKLGLNRQALRRRLPQMIRNEEVDEDALVSEWLMLYATVMDYAAEQTAEPTPVARMREDQGPQNAALAVFGPLVWS